jgi:alanine racemase
MSIHLPIDTADSGADTPDRSVRHRPTRAEIDTGALQRNVARFVARTDAHVCAVVKADGYGHGALLVARAALAGGASWLAVALVEEAAELRAAGIDAPILLLSEPPTSAVDAVLDLDLTPTVYRPEFMARVGVPAEEWDPVLALLAGAAALDVEGYQTHLARADEPGSPTTDEQLVRFRAGLAQVVAHGLVPRLLHVANSAGILMHPASWQAALTQLLPSAQVLVRPGIAVYGLSPGDEVLASDHGFEPALRLVSAVSQVRRLAAGTPVSYGHRWAARRTC